MPPVREVSPPPTQNRLNSVPPPSSPHSSPSAPVTKRLPLSTRLASFLSFSTSLHLSSLTPPLSTSLPSQLPLPTTPLPLPSLPPSPPPSLSPSLQPPPPPSPLPPSPPLPTSLSPPSSLPPPTPNVHELSPPPPSPIAAALPNPSEDTQAEANSRRAQEEASVSSIGQGDASPTTKPQQQPQLQQPPMQAQRLRRQ